MKDSRLFNNCAKKKTKRIKRKPRYSALIPNLKKFYLKEQSLSPFPHSWETTLRSIQKKSLRKLCKTTISWASVNYWYARKPSAIFEKIPLTMDKSLCMYLLRCAKLLTSWMWEIVQSFTSSDCFKDACSGHRIWFYKYRRQYYWTIGSWQVLAEKLSL